MKKAVPGSVVEAYKSPKEALPHVADADAIALWVQQYLFYYKRSTRRSVAHKK